MADLILRCAAVLLMFSFGPGGNSLFNRLDSLVERWIETAVPVLEEPCASLMAAQPAMIHFVSACSSDQLLSSSSIPALRQSSP